jgi:hypothetical protein
MRKPKSAPLSSAKIPTTDQDHIRDRHGFRGVPPVPVNFSLAALADDALLTEYEVAAALRVSTNTLGCWRQQPAHALRWLTLPNGFVRYQVSAIRAFLAMGRSRAHKPSADRALVNPSKPPATASRRRAPKPNRQSNAGVAP